MAPLSTNKIHLWVAFFTVSPVLYDVGIDIHRIPQNFGVFSCHLKTDVSVIVSKWHQSYLKTTPPRSSPKPAGLEKEETKQMPFLWGNIGTIWHCMNSKTWELGPKKMVKSTSFRVIPENLPLLIPSKIMASEKSHPQKPFYLERIDGDSRHSHSSWFIITPYFSPTNRHSGDGHLGVKKPPLWAPTLAATCKISSLRR